MRLFSMSLALAGVCLLPPAAKADTFNFSAVGSGGGFSGSGVLTGFSNGDGSYTLTDISGTGVTGLIPANQFGNDNLLFPNASRLVDVNGFAFTEALAGMNLSVNLFSTVAGYEVVTLDDEGDFTDTPVAFTIANNSAVPEPGSLLLMGSGLLGMAVTGVRRRFSR